MTLGDKLSRLRKQHNYTQEQLADIVGVSRQSISKWESDAAYPETDKLIVLSKLFHCTVDYLLNDDMDESAPSATEQANKGKALGMGVLNYAPSVLFLVWALSLWAMFAINTVKGGGDTNLYHVVASNVWLDLRPAMCVLLCFAGVATLYGAAMTVCRRFADNAVNALLLYVSYALYAAVFGCGLALLVQTAYLGSVKGALAATTFAVTVVFAALQTGTALLRSYFFDTLKNAARKFSQGVTLAGKWFWAKRVVTFSVTAAVIVCVTLAVALPVTLCSPLRLSVAESIRFGESRLEVRKKLGKPLDVTALEEYMDSSSGITSEQMKNVDLYCTPKARRYINETLRLIKLMDGDARPSGNELAIASTKLLQLSNYLSTLKMKNLAVEFDDQGVCCVEFDNKCNGLGADQAKWNKRGNHKQRVDLLDAALPFGTLPEEAHLKYRVYYTDGSYRMDRTENVSGEGNYNDGWQITWSDGWGTYSKKVYEEVASNGIRGISGYACFALIPLEGGGYKLSLSPSDVYGTDNFDEYRGQIKEVALQEGLTEIPDDCFSGIDSLTEIVLPKSVTRIGKRAFYNCINLKGIALSYNLTEIDDSAFEGCTSLLVTEGEAAFLTRIGKRAFYNCSLLDGWRYIPDSITVIDDYAFYNCKSFGKSWLGEDIYLPSNAAVIGDGAFQNCISLNRLFCNNYYLSGGRMTIGDYAFAGCTGLTWVQFNGGRDGDTTTYAIGSHCFDGCTELTYCYIDVYGKIPQYAFANCTNLIHFEDRTWGSKGFQYVTTIESCAFLNCKVLGTMSFRALKRIEARAFEGCDEVDLEVPYVKWSVTNGSYTTTVDTETGAIFDFLIQSFVDFTWTGLE